MNLGEFIDTYKEAIAQRVVESYPPLYRPSENGGTLPRLLRTPLGAQGDAIRGAALSLEAHRGTTVVGEMGTGKTFIGAAAAHMAGFQRILVLCPPHLVPKWKREVEQTVPLARAAIVESITDLERLRLSIGSGPLFAVMSRERAKLSYRWQAAVIQRWATSKGRLVRDEETGEPFRVPCCPDCTAQITDKDGVPLTDADLNRRRHVCSHCGSPLWQADKSGPKRYPLADYVKHHMGGFFDLLITDEVHEYKGRGSAQGIAAGVLADACGKSLSLSGTLMGGYSSTLFHLLYRFSPEIRTEFGRSEEGRWIERYGFVEHSIGKPDDESMEDGRNSRRKKFRKVVRERPGLAPSALFHLIGNTVFLRLSDVASGLPDYTEQILLSSMDSEKDHTGYSQRSAYDTVFEELRKELAEALKSGSKRLLATYLQTLAGLPGRVHQGGDGLRPQERRRHRAGAAPLREQAVPEGAGAHRPGGRRADGGPQGAGLRHPHGDPGHHRAHGRHPHPARLPGGGDEGRRRGSQQEGEVGGRQGEAGHRRDDLPSQAGADRPRPHRLSDPLLVRDRLFGLRYASGFPTVLAHRADAPGESGVHVLPQHPTGRRPQAGGEEAAKLPCRRGRAAGGRACRLRGRRRRHDDGPGPQDRQRRGGGRRAETVEEVFAQARNAESTAEELLVDDGWKLVEVEPETVGVNGNGTNGHHANGNGHHDAIGIGPTVELVPVNGHAPANGNGNGHHEEAEEPQQTLFSWAEFMAEPVKPKGRKSKAQPASMSMFEWAMEREAEPVGAGR